MNIAYRFRIYPNREQEVLLAKTFGCCRFLYNQMLNDKIREYKATKKMLRNTPAMYKKAYPFLKEVDSLALANVQMHLEKAYKNFFRDPKIGFPKFKSKHRDKSTFKNINSVKIDFENNKIKIPILGWVKFYKNRSFEGKIGTITVSKSSTGKYYVSVLVEDGNSLPEKNPIVPSTSVGIDVGLKDFAVLSNGQVFQNPKYLEKFSKRLACLQRRLSRKKKGSNRYKKAKLTVAICHERIKNRRQDFLHKVSKRIISENQTVIIEDLNVEGYLYGNVGLYF